MPMTVSGMSEYAKELLDIAEKKVPHAVTNASLELGLLLEANVKLLTPVDFGRLRASWGHWTPDMVLTRSAHSHRSLFLLGDDEVPSDKDSHWSQYRLPGGSFVVEVGTNVEYAPYVEFGTQKTEGRHMLELGVNATSKAVEQVLLKHINQALGLG